jgi:hypothetical protein
VDSLASESLALVCAAAYIAWERVTDECSSVVNDHIFGGKITVAENSRSV